MERLVELLDALALEHLDDIVVVDAGLGEALERPVGPVDVALEGALTRPWSSNASTSREASC